MRTLRHYLLALALLCAAIVSGCATTPTALHPHRMGDVFTGTPNYALCDVALAEICNDTTPQGNGIQGEQLWKVGGKYNANFQFLSPLWGLPANSVPCNSTVAADALGFCIAGQGITISDGIISSSGGGGGGGISAITFTAPSMFAVTGSPLTANGTIALNYSGTPLPIANGGTGAASLLAADIPIFMGSITPTHCAEWTSSGVLQDSGAGCGSGGSGLTSVGLSTTATWLTVSSSPLTANGTITINPTSGEGQNQVVATPNGTSGPVGLRALVAADLPAALASSTSINGTTIPASAGTAPGSTGSFTVGDCVKIASTSPLEITDQGTACSVPTQSQRSVSANDTMILGDAGNKIYINCASACIETIPVHTSVAWSIPSKVEIIVDHASATVTLAITTDTLWFSPVNTTGTRTLAAGAHVFIDYYATGNWQTTGTGET